MSELCLKDNVVAIIEDVNGRPSKIKKIVAPELVPLNLKKDFTIEDLIEWLSKRGIPENREGLEDVKKIWGDAWRANNGIMMTSYRYASLSDHYWIKRRDETWKRINYFTNRYSTDIGDMFFFPWKTSGRKSIKIDNNSPDLSTSGILRKRWMQNPDKTSSLIKAGSFVAKQEPLSEVLVSVLIERLNIPILRSAKYDLHIEGVLMCSRCNNFVNENIDLVPASHLYFQTQRQEDESVYEHLIKACEKADVPNAEDFINYLIFVDRLTGNTDRHLDNIGFLRDINTMKFIGPAPVFDCGNAYWSKKAINEEKESILFGDIEQEIFKLVLKKCDMNAILKNDDYKKIIDSYPGLSDDKKAKLITAIKDKNQHMCLGREEERTR